MEKEIHLTPNALHDKCDKHGHIAISCWYFFDPNFNPNASNDAQFFGGTP